MNSVEKVRLDKWLWSVRIFKTRSLAGDKCRDGDVRLSGRKLKPSYIVSRGEILEVHKNGFKYSIKVLSLINKRVSASIAQECFEDLTPESELNKYDEWYVGKSKGESREKGLGRPTKKERRILDEYKKRRY